MLVNIFSKLDEWIYSQNQLATEGGGLLISPCTFKLLGQSALIEARLGFELARTADVDAYYDAPYKALQQLDVLLAKHGMHLDPLGQEVWMPAETKYDSLFSGQYLELQLAQAVYVLTSKSLKAPEKNKEIISQYLASEPEEEFFALCERYNVELEFFVS